MAKMSLELSDTLFELRRELTSRFPAGGMVLDDEQTSLLTQTLKELGVIARRLENEVSRHRWNEQARQDAKRQARETDRVLAELQRPDTNLRLFPVVPRPFSDGMPGGAA